MRDGPKLVKRENGYYYIYYGRRNQKSLGTKDKATARQLFEQKVRDLRDGKITQLDKVKRIRLSEFRDEYLAMRELECAMRSLSKNTLRNDRLALNRLFSVLGDMPLRSIGKKQREDFKLRCLAGATDVERRKNGINAYIRHIRAAFNWAMLHDPEDGKLAYIEKNPFKKEGREKVEFAIGRRMPKYSDKNELLAIFRQLADDISTVAAALEMAPSAGLSRLEIAHLKELVAGSREFRYMVICYLYSGLRRVELMAIEARDLKFDLGMVRVVGKGDKEAYVAMHPMFKWAIQKMGVPDVGRVFSRWEHPDTITHKFTEVARRAGVNKTLHSLRHAYATYSLDSGIDIKSVQEELRHSNLDTTLIYAQMVRSRRRENIKKLTFGIEAEIMNG